MAPKPKPKPRKGIKTPTPGPFNVTSIGGLIGKPWSHTSTKGFIGLPDAPDQENKIHWGRVKKAVRKWKGKG